MLLDSGDDVLQRDISSVAMRTLIAVQHEHDSNKRLGRTNTRRSPAGVWVLSSRELGGMPAPSVARRSDRAQRSSFTGAVRTAALRLRRIH